MAGSERSGRWGAAIELWALAWPAIVRMLLSCGCDRLTLGMVGHWDNVTSHFDGAGL